MNPFAVLGISATAIRGLKDEQTATLVKAMHRALSLIHHPDRGGKQAKFRTLQEALEELDWDANPEQFRYWREQLLRTPKQQRSDADSERAALTHRQTIAEDGLCDFAKTCAGLVAIPAEANSILCLNDVRILIYETLFNTLIHRQSTLAVSSDKLQSCCELEIASGNITRYLLRRQSFSVDDIPPHHEAWGHKSRKKGERDVWVRTGVCEVLRDTRIIGAIPRESLDSSDDGPRGLTPLLAGLEDTDHDLTAVRNGYSWDTFRRFGAMMKPFFRPQDELICIAGDQFIPVGRIRGICSIKEWPEA